VLAILVDENMDGYAAYLLRLIFSAEWSGISSQLGVRIVKFAEAGLAKGTRDDQFYLP
jgi:hypothetical protein